jgi:Flp pilus assembly protein TadG
MTKTVRAGSDREIPHVLIKKDESGGVAILFALALLMLASVVGLAIDFSRGSRAHARLQAIADAVTLAGVKGMRQSPEFARQQAESVVSSQNVDELTGITTDIVIDDVKHEVHTVLTADLPTTFQRLMNVQNMRLRAESKGKREFNFMDVHIVLDVSDSMELAATPDEMIRLKALTKPYIDQAVANGAPQVLAAENGCAFACHENPGWLPAGVTFLSIARANNVLLRSDVMIAAAQLMTDSLLVPPSNDTGTTTIRVGAFAISEEAEKLSDPSTDVNSVKASFSTSTILHRDTLFDITLPEVLTMVGPNGDGSSQATPKKVVVIATDGVYGGNNTPGASDRPLDPALCQSFKDQGIQVAVINIEYINDQASPVTQSRIGAIHPDILPNLQECASSSNLYLDASSADSIRAAFYEMANRVRDMSQMRLTQ